MCVRGTKHGIEKSADKLSYPGLLFLRLCLLSSRDGVRQDFFFSRGDFFFVFPIHWHGNRCWKLRDSVYALCTSAWCVPALYSRSRRPPPVTCWLVATSSSPTQSHLCFVFFLNPFFFFFPFWFCVISQFIWNVLSLSCLFDRFVMVFACLALSVFSTIEEFQESADVALLYMEGLVVFWFTVEFIFR
jgi:hypothetical protein